MALSVGAMIGYSILGTFGAYVFTSVVLLKFPTILHTKKKRYYYCSHISHRGGAAENIENTITAFKHAQACGTHLFELDVHRSKDNKVVVAHDLELERMTGVKGKISDYNYEDLPSYLDELDVTFSKELSGRNSSKEEMRMPLLDEVFTKFPQMPVNIDVKDNDDELIEQVVKLVAKHQRDNLVCWGNSDAKIINKLHEKNPNVAYFFSVKRTALLLLWFYTGLLPFMPLKERFFEVPLPTIFYKMRTELTTFQRFCISVFNFIFTSKVLVKHLKDRGIPTYFWVLNDEADYLKAFELGAEGVMTDRPAKLRYWLNLHPQFDKLAHDEKQQLIMQQQQLNKLPTAATQQQS